MDAVMGGRVFRKSQKAKVKQRETRNREGRKRGIEKGSTGDWAIERGDNEAYEWLSSYNFRG
jgi:hypothetical protein